METREDLEEYLLELLDKENPTHNKFIKHFLDKWRPLGPTIPENVIVSSHFSRSKMIVV